MTSNANRKSLLLVMMTCTISLFGCGGGGGGESNPATTATVTQPVTTVVATTPVTTVVVPVVDYTPDSDKLALEAETSLDLFVETDFNFNSFREIGLDINVQSFEGKYIADSLVYISSLPDGIVELDDERMSERSLIAVTKTDGNGHSLVRFETPQVVNNLLIEIRSLGVNNKHIVDISEQDYLVLSLN